MITIQIFISNTETGIISQFGIYLKQDLKAWRKFSQLKMINLFNLYLTFLQDILCKINFLNSNTSMKTLILKPGKQSLNKAPNIITNTTCRRWQLPLNYEHVT